MDGTVESQRIIRDALSDQAMENSDEEQCIHDRCILDNLMYTLYLAETGKIDDDEFIGESFHITREVLKMYDVIFFLPLSKLSPVNLEERDDRELDLNYRKSINTLFLEAQQSYKNREGLIFPLENSPAFIEIFGDEDNGEKTAMAGLYIQDGGDFKSTDESLLKTIEHAAENEALEQALLSQLSVE